MISESHVLWREIIKKRNFDEKYYDKEEAEIIKKSLDLQNYGTIYSGLKYKKITIEDFIKVFFEVSKSFTAMMNDLLNMFEEINAKETDNKLEISFEFEKNKPYTINLESFKSFIKKMKDIEKEIVIPDNPNLNDYRNFSNKLLALDFPGKINCEIVDYRKFDINITQTDNLEFNSLSKDVKCLLLEIVTKIKEYGYDKRTLKEYFNENDYVKMAIDYYPWMIASQLESLTQNFDSLKKSHQKDCISCIKTFLNKSGFSKKTITEKVEVLEEFLDLPFWKKRHELYSVWIFTLIYDAIKNYNHKVHVVDGKLIFPFRETHLATIYKKNQDNIYIYCEKKTALDNPEGKGRTGNIQPDYSFFVEPLSNINSSILEIECKQYKKQSTDNFARALVDYSNGRPKSKVFLINHGDINYKRIEKKAKSFKLPFYTERCSVFGNVVPNNKAKDSMKKEIEKILFPKNIITNKTKIKVILTWDEKPNDLDLWCTYNGNKKFVVNHSNMSKNGIVLKKDITTGFGPEEIEFTVYENSKYIIEVIDYKSTVDFNNSDAKVEFYFDDILIQEYKLDNKYIIDNKWDVCSLNIKKMGNNSFEIDFSKQ